MKDYSKAYPDFYKMNNWELISFIQTPGVMEAIVRTARLENYGRFDITPMPLEELVFVTKYSLTVSMLKIALDELSPNEIIDLWLKKGDNNKLKKGARTKFGYDRCLAWMDIQKMKPMQAYYAYVLPWMLEVGEIQTDSNGEPDPFQEQEARKNWLKAVDRRKKATKYTP